MGRHGIVPAAFGGQGSTRPAQGVRGSASAVLGQGASVLLFTDGLERDGGEELGREMERLHKSARRVIWLNPLLRYDRFEPRAQGIRAILPHVDEFRPVHNLASITDLVGALSGQAGAASTDPRLWLRRTG